MRKLLFGLVIVISIVGTQVGLNLLSQWDGPKAIGEMEAYAANLTVAGSLIKDVVDASTIPTAYTSGGAEIITGTKQRAHIGVVNNSDGEIVVCIKQSVAADCIDDDLYLPATSSLALDNIGMGDKIFVKRFAGALTGTIWVGAW